MAVLTAQPAAASKANARRCIPLHIALQKSAPSEIVIELLRIHPSAATAPNVHGDLPLHVALQNCASYGVVRKLLGVHPSSVEAPNASGYLPIHVAAQHGAPFEIVRMLLEAYPESVFEALHSGLLPFHLAVASHQSCQTASALFQANPEAARIFLNGFPLAVVGDNPSLDLIQALLDTYKVHADGGTRPLHVALKRQAPWQMVSAVLLMHPEAASVSESGSLPLHVAVSSRVSSMTLEAVFQAYPAAARTSNMNGDLPFHIALSLDAPVEDVCLLLLQYSKAIHSQATLGDLSCEAYITSILIPVATYFARRGNLTGLAYIVELGFITINTFYDATVCMLERSQPADDVSSSTVCSVLRRWHHGSLLWNQFRKRTLQQAVRSSSVSAKIWTFLFNGCAQEDGSYFAASIANKLADTSEEFNIEHLSQSEHAVPEDTTSHTLDISDTVIQCVAHADPAAYISDEEASQVVDIQHACFIERYLMSSAGIEEAETSEEDTETIWISKINRNTKNLREELKTGPSLRPYRDGLASEGYPCEHPSGALLFIFPWQYRQVMIKLESIELFPDHIIFAGSLKFLVEESLSRCNGTCKSICQLGQVTSNSSDVAIVGSEVAADDNHSQVMYVCDFVVKRTFVHAQPFVQSSSRITSSTTDAHLGDAANPRRAKLVTSFSM